MKIITNQKIIQKSLRYVLALCLLGSGTLGVQNAYGGAWANYNAKIIPLFEVENERLDRVHHPVKQIELGFTVELKQNGAVREVKIITSSGSDELDAIAVQSAFDLSPLPTPPASVFFRQFFTPLTLRYKFNPRSSSDAAPTRNVTEQQQGTVDNTTENSKNRSEQTQSGRSDLIVFLQTDLAHLGFDPGPVDGYFGRRTEAAIRNFQSQTGLPVDGKPSKNLLRQLSDYKKGRGLSESTAFGAEPDDSDGSDPSSTAQSANTRLSRRIYEDYEYIDPSIPRVYEDYEYIDQ